MSVTDRSDYLLADVRHTKSNESVACSNPRHQERWAKYVVQVGSTAPGVWTRPNYLYLCKPCMSEFLFLSEGFAAV